MADSMKMTMTKEKVRIHIPGNRKYYKIRPRKTKKSKKGYIFSEWSLR
jgi:hypothetical protein